MLCVYIIVIIEVLGESLYVILIECIVFKDLNIKLQLQEFSKIEEVDYELFGIKSWEEILKIGFFGVFFGRNKNVLKWIMG